MNNKIVFDDNNQIDSNAELLKENTPTTIDYNKLYNINNNANNNNNNINYNKTQNIENNVSINNNIKPETTVNKNNENKKGINSLLLVFLIFIIITGIVIFLFPFLGKLILK